MTARLVGLGALALGAASPAAAGSLDLSAGVLVYRASPSQISNQLGITLDGAVYTIDDPGEATLDILPGALAAGCAALDDDTATCPAAAVTSIDAATFSGNDVVTLAGETAAAVVSGGQGNDVLFGGGGEETFTWEQGDGSDVIDGGPGPDTLVFRGASTSESYTVTASGAGFELRRDTGSIRMTVLDVEFLDLFVGSGSDTVATAALAATTQTVRDAGDGFTDTLVVDALGLCATWVNDASGSRYEVAGRLPIHFQPGDFQFVSAINSVCEAPGPCAAAVPTEGCTVNGAPNQTCTGTPGDDTIVGTASDDVIQGGGGSDRIRGGRGDDLLCGDGGDDTIAGGPGDDTIVGSDGDDQLKGDSGNDLLLGGRDHDVLSGATGDDELDGGDGDDRLRGMGGTDRIEGGPGVDLLDGGPAIDACADIDQPGPFARCP